MEEKELKVTFNKSGAGNITPRLTLPTSWVKELGLDKDNRVIKAIFDGNKIIIEKINNF